MEQVECAECDSLVDKDESMLCDECRFTFCEECYYDHLSTDHGEKE